MVFSFSRWSRRPRDLSWGPSGAGGMAKPICAISPVTAASWWRALSRPRRAMRPASRFRDLPSPCPGRTNKRHFSVFCAFLPCTRRILLLVALDNHAFSGPGRGLKLTLGPLVGAIAILAVVLVLGAI